MTQVELEDSALTQNRETHPPPGLKLLPVEESSIISIKYSHHSSLDRVQNFNLEKI